MDVQQESVAGLRNGCTSVGTSATRLTDNQIGKCKKGIHFQAPTSNSESVYVGAKGVTANSGANGGTQIYPGDAIFLPIENPDEVWLVSPSNGEIIAWLAV